MTESSSNTDSEFKKKHNTQGHTVLEGIIDGVLLDQETSHITGVRLIPDNLDSICPNLPQRYFLFPQMKFLVGLSIKEGDRIEVCVDREKHWFLGCYNKTTNITYDYGYCNDDRNYGKSKEKP